MDSEAAQTPAQWQDLLAARRFGAARQAYLVEQATLAATGAAPPDDRLRSALAALADVEDLLRERSYLRAEERIERLEEKLDSFPWAELLDNVKVLGRSAKALDKRDPEAATTELAALEGSWFYAEVLAQRGTALIFQGQPEEATQAFQQALDIDPQHYRALTNLGNVALEKGEVDAAIDYYQRALKLNEEFPNAHHNLGVAYRRKGMLNQSVKSLRKAQRASQRLEASQARERMSRWSGARGVGGAGGMKIFRWLLYGAVAVVLYLILSNRGII